MQLSERRDARRLLTAVLAAIVVHAGLFVGIPFLTSLDTSPLPDYGPVIVRVELPEAKVEPAPVVEAAPRPEPAARPAPKPAAKPAARTPVPATTAKPASSAAASVAATRSPGTSAFRQSGATTGTSTGPADPSSKTSPPQVDLPPTLGGSEQRSGEAVSLTSQPAGGTIELGTLDKSLAGAATSGTATSASGAAPAAGSGTPASSSDASIAWKNTDAAKGRKVTSVPDVPWPDWVKESGEVLEVRIEFSVNAAGLVSSARVAQGSGYTDVDDACRRAMLKYGFTPSPGAAVIQGEALFSTVLKH